jgi:hypothetical protein
MKQARSRRSLRFVKQVSCSCGHVASAETAEELLTAVEAHIAARHAAAAAITSSAGVHLVEIRETSAGGQEPETA